MAKRKRQKSLKENGPEPQGRLYVHCDKCQAFIRWGQLKQRNDGTRYGKCFNCGNRIEIKSLKQISREN